MIMKMRNMMKRKNGQKGFTLVELIVVMAILAILAAIAVPRYNSTLNGAKEKADIATARTIQSAAMLYQANSSTNALPTSITSDTMAEYLAADVFDDDKTVKAPQQGGDFHFYYNSSTGSCVCANTKPESYAQID